MRIAALALTLLMLLALGFAAPPPASADCATTHTVATAIQGSNADIGTANAKGISNFIPSITLADSGGTTIIPTESPPVLAASRAYILNSTPTTYEAGQANPYISDVAISPGANRHLDVVSSKPGHHLRR